MFNPAVDRGRLKGDEVTFVDPYGISHSWKPEFHVSKNICWISMTSYSGLVRGGYRKM